MTQINWVSVIKESPNHYPENIIDHNRYRIRPVELFDPSDIYLIKGVDKPI